MNVSRSVYSGLIAFWILLGFCCFSGFSQAEETPVYSIPEPSEKSSSYLSKNEVELIFGVYAYQTEETVQEQYQGLADYLSDSVEGAKISMEVMSSDEILRAVKNGEIDLLLPNPSLYEIIRNEVELGGVVATIEMLSQSGQATSQLGGVIFTQASNQSINTISDISNKKVAIPSLSNTGACRIPAYEAIKNGIPRSKLKFVQKGNNDAVVEAVLSGEAEVGFVRTGILEHWFEDKKLNPKLIKVVHTKKVEGFPYLLSTDLYPEWPFVVTAKLDKDLVRDISAALFSLHSDHPAAVQAQIAGFIPPRDYLPLELLLRELRLPPYDKVPEFSVAEVVKRHPYVFILSGMMIFVLLVAYVFSTVLLGRLKDKSEKLEELMFATRAMTWEWHIPSGKVEINRNWANIIGYEPEELQPFSSDSWWAMMHPDDIPSVSQQLEEYFDNETDSFEAEFRLRHKQGAWLWVLARGRVVESDYDEKPLRMAGTHTDINELKLKEKLLEYNAQRDKALLELPSAAERMEEHEFLQYAQAFTEKLTASKISFIHFMSEDQQSIELVTWSKRTLQEYCSVAEFEQHYPLSKAGVWADAARYQKPVIINDYDSFPDKKGVPEGHVELQRMITVPVLEQDEVVMLTGVGNKDDDYGPQDVESVQLISNEIWRLMQKKRIQQKILEQTEQYQRLVNDLGPNYVVFSHSGEEGVLTYVSETIEDVFGVSSQEAIGSLWGEIIDWLPESVEHASGYLNALFSGADDYNQFDMCFYHPVDGEIRTIRVSQRAVRDKDSHVVSIDGLVVNISDEIEADKKLQEAARVFEYAQEGILIASPESKIVNVNAAFTRITGYSKTDVMGKNPNVLSSGRQSKEFYKDMWETLLKSGNWYGEIWNRRKNGEVYPQKINITTVKNDEGEVQQYIALFSDISVEKRQQAELEFIAHFDPLTGLPNRVLLTDRLNQAIVHSERHHNLIAVIFIDLDGFKEINDKYGHSTGDSLLEVLAMRFKNTVRKEDTVSRIGGDEFVAVFSDFDSQENLHQVLERLLADANRAFDYKGVEMSVSASIGVVLYDGQGEGVSADLLMRQADQAMYQAKVAGKNQIAYFEKIDNSALVDAVEQKKRLDEIECAMKNGEFELFYQPKLSVKSGQACAFEALARWRKPDEGIMAPYFFLPYLEGQSLGVQFGYWVIEESLRQMKQWQASGHDYSISVNIDGYLLEQPDFVERIESLLARYTEVSPKKLTMELLESSALEDIEQVSAIINQVRDFGVKFAIDDFGTGYASLSYLKQLPVDELKIDQSFIKDIFDQPQGLVILESVLSMGRAFDMQVVAEGVETEGHVELLLKLGVEYLQGYAISRPMEANAVFNWVESYGIQERFAEVPLMDRDRVGLLMAGLEYRGWHEKLVACIHEDNCQATELSSPFNCGFGRWLYSHGKSFFSKEAFAEIEFLHERVHSLGEQALAYKRSGQLKYAKEELTRLETIGSQMLEVLEQY